jgi:hypothetical protein
VQHTKAVTGYHGPNRDTDAIVMGGRFSLWRPTVFEMSKLAGLEISILSKWRVALTVPPWLASL